MPDLSRPPSITDDGGWIDAAEPDPLEEAQCAVCNAWLDDERLAVANDDREKPATCSNVECQKEYP